MPDDCPSADVGDASIKKGGIATDHRKVVESAANDCCMLPETLVVQLSVDQR